MTTIPRFAVTVIVLALGSAHVFAQSKCLGPEDVKAMVARLNSSQNGAPNLQLHDELLKLAAQTESLIYNSMEEKAPNDASRSRLKEAVGKNNARLCQILKEFGWPTSALVGQDGVSSTLYLLRNSRQLELQRDLLPVIDAAVKRGEVQKGELAHLIDRLRVDVGMKQLFGTHVKLKNGFLVLLPIEDEALVDERRRQFGLPPLTEQLRELERDYQRPLIRSVAPNQPLNPSQSSTAGTIGTSLIAEKPDEDEVIRVNTNLVSLNVSVFSNKLQSLVGMLEKNDFRVLEDGRDETISNFAATDVPFDLVLLVDLSGSTADKRKLISKTTERFIEAARPTDRLAIVTFDVTTDIVCDLTADHAKLLKSVRRMKGTGGTNFWDALKYTLDTVVGPRTLERRRAIVIMSDGVDNALAFGGSNGSRISFADLLEAVRKSDELIIPIYLDTERDQRYNNDFSQRVYDNARNTLALLAQESGGFYYKARKIEDLNGVYDQVINDLGKVYSVGYRPTNEKRDGSWRRVEIRIPNRPDLSVRSRPGYYAH
jgi:VWFA-related protein